MKSQETLSKIMELLNLSEDKKVELATEKLDNGAVLEAESFEAGYEVFVVTEDAKVPAPVGEHTLEDGRVLVIEEEGLIASIGEASEEESEESAPDQEPAEEEMAEEESTEEAEEEKKEMELTEDRVREIVQEMLQEMMSKDEVKEEEVKEEPKVEMSAAPLPTASDDAPAASAIKHSPEATAKEMINMAKKGAKGTTASVFAKMAQF